MNQILEKLIEIKIKEKKRIMNEINLTEGQMDMLKEIGNIGSGHAITALSEILNTNVEVSLTSVDINSFWKVPELFENPHREVVALYSEIKFNSTLSIIQIFTKESMINLINMLNEDTRIDGTSINDLDEFSYSIINEIGNILNGHYASALADLLSIKLIPNVPRIAFDTLNAILNSIIAKYSQIVDYLLTINTKLTVSNLDIDGTICLIPSVDILKRLFEILNIKYNMNL
jgi:chemotaxis protein CheC